MKTITTIFVGGGILTGGYKLRNYQQQSIVKIFGSQLCGGWHSQHKKKYVKKYVKESDRYYSFQTKTQSKITKYDMEKKGGSCSIQTETLVKNNNNNNPTRSEFAIEKRGDFLIQAQIKEMRDKWDIEEPSKYYTIYKIWVKPKGEFFGKYQQKID